MRSLAFICLTTLITFIIQTPLATAKCCRPDRGGDCGDNSAGTPCCAYNKCNGFCCACEGVVVTRQPVEVEDGNGKYHMTIRVITADCGVSWTCREDHITKQPPTSQCSYPVPPTKRDEAVAMNAPARLHERVPTPVPVEQSDYLANMAESYHTFMSVSEGSGNITLTQYLNFFGFSADASVEVGSLRKDTIIEIFHRRDRDNNGVLTQEEVDELLGPDDLD